MPSGSNPITEPNDNYYTIHQPLRSFSLLISQSLNPSSQLFRTPCNLERQRWQTFHEDVPIPIVINVLPFPAFILELVNAF